MSALLLGVVCGALAACAGLLLAALLLLRRNSRAEQRMLHRILAVSALWWWESDEQGRLRRIQPGRRFPQWLSAGSMLGLPFWQLPGADEGAAPGELRAAVAARRAFYDLAVPLAGAPEACVWLSAEPTFDPRGRFLGFAGTARLPADAPVQAPDAQARIEQLELAQAAERAELTRQAQFASKELESFSYSVSHDLRAPLRVVDGFATILLEDYGSRLDDIGRDHVRRISAAAARMNKMIDALLGLVKRTAGELHVEAVDLSRAARELVDELRATDRARSVEFRIAPDLRAQGDPALLRTVLDNLLGNAFKFSAHVPQAVIEFGQHLVDGADIFFVRDNGAGFDMRFADRLFAPFQRLHSANDFAGTGLGLANVQRIVRKHGGRIWVESEPGKGACFYFTLGAAER